MPKVVTTRTGKKQVILHPSTVRSGGVKNIIFDELEDTPRNVKPKLTSAGEGSATVNVIDALESEIDANLDALPSLGEFLDSDKMAAKGKKRSKSKSRTSTKRTRSKSSTKKTSSKKKKRSTTASLSGPVAKNIAGMLNPFAHANGVQIPDGAVPSSLGRFFRNVFQVEAPFYTTKDSDEMFADGTTQIMVYPGLHSGCVWAKNEPDGANEMLTIQRYSHENQSFKGQLTLSSAQDAVNGYYNTKPADSNDVALKVPMNEPFGKLFLEDSLVKWRIASQGLRLKLLNADENNDGWFEAIRVSYKIDNEDWSLKGPVNVTNAGTNIESWLSPTQNGLRFNPTDKMFDRLESLNWAENKSYVCDSLKNIHKYQFNLETYTGQNAFQDMRRQYETHRVLGKEMYYANQPANSANPWPVTGQHPVEFPFCEGEEDATEFIRSFVDRDHDIVMIRIHPGRGTGAVGAPIDGTDTPPNAAVLLAEHVCNQEIVYETDSALGPLMKDAPVAVAATVRAHAIKRDNADTIMATA